MKFRHVSGYAPVILSAILFAVYLSTICPEIYLGDSGEFAAAAFCLGIPHNSGYPLYALLGKIFCFIPFGNIAFRLNLMSSTFAVLTVWLVHGMIFKLTSSRVSAFAGALFLAFAPLFWQQTLCAEVYALHAFFVILLIRLLWEWEEKRDFFRLLLFVFATGVSFGNHMQTVMLAPAVLFLILSGDRKALFQVKHFVLISCFFVLPLLIYLYLPIRTNADAAIHWGDPNTFRNFLEHVTASTHREAYVLTKGPWDYLMRANEALWTVARQFGVLLVFALWGWFKVTRVRWRVFFAGIILFDFVYTVFFNIIALDITAFNIPTLIVLSTLAGVGIAHIVKACGSSPSIGERVQRVIQAAFCAMPAIPLLFNFGLCNQGRNYLAYDHALNIFRTLGHGSILFIDGDNNIFPVTYGRVVERMREDVTLYDRYNLFFRMPYLGEDRETFSFHGNWNAIRAILEKKIIEKTVKQGVYFAVFDPNIVSVPKAYFRVPFGILSQVFRDASDFDRQSAEKVWDYYATESFQEDFERDYLNRQLCAYFYFRRGIYFIENGKTDIGFRYTKRASIMGYDDRMIHSDIAVFLSDHGFHEEAREELEKAQRYYEELSGVHNNWGYYYYNLRDYDRAIRSFRKAIALNPGKPSYRNNLGFSLYEAGRREEAGLAFRKSLSIREDQPAIKRFMEEKGL